MRYGYFDAEITGTDENGMPVFDRAENAEFFCKLFSILLSNGVLVTPSTNLQVTAATGMTLAVRPGFGLIDGHFAWAETAETLTVEAATSLVRVDRVVLRLDYVNRLLCTAVLKGTAGSTSPPALTRNDDAYELALADVTVPANATALSQANITDRRQDASVCGLIAGLVDQIDAGGLFAQFTAAFTLWFDQIKGQLSEDAAGNLELHKADKAQTVLVSLPASGWGESAPHTQVVGLSALTALNVGHVFATVQLSETQAAAQLEQEAWNCVSRVTPQEGGVVVTCFEEKPKTDVTMRLEVMD